MRIAFNAQLLVEPRTGTGRYVYNLLSALGRLDLSTEYHILAAQPLPERPETPPTMSWETISVGGFGAKRPGVEKLIWEQRAFPRAARALKADLMHIPYFAPPLRTFGIPTIVTILDVIPQRLPAYRASASQQAYAQLVAGASRHATAVIAISNHCKQDIIETLHIPADRIFVTYLAPDPRLRPAAPNAQQELRHKFGLKGPFVLNVGGIDVRKNTAGLIEAFAEVYRQLGNPDLRLFIVASPAQIGTSVIFPDWRPLAKRLGVVDQIMCTSLDEADLATIYSAADCFAFTSLYEGFGLTPLEAMACGAPVVCSDKTSLPEVVGDAALLVDPLDTRALSSAMLHVLTSPKTAQELRARGLARAQTFTWERAAAETSAIYTCVVEGGGHPRALKR
jgi:glycosyltransferase involved in cell wall biosynthesis